MTRDIFCVLLLLLTLSMLTIGLGFNRAAIAYSSHPNFVKPYTNVK